jgi:nitroimidazol reductase NimA-like FMN-containing flavoprotein (pyridoxamine 5'-phosphate oxidase superfamily)
MSALSMTRAEREAFLAGLHVGIFSIADGEKGPIAAPVWYGYEPGGDVWFATGRESDKGRLAVEGARATFVVQEESLPYRYVTIEGPISLEECDFKTHIKPMAYKYLGQEEGERYLRAGGDGSNSSASIIVRIKPERWRTQDYGKVGG